MKKVNSLILSTIFVICTFFTSTIQVKAATIAAEYQTPYGFDTYKSNVKYGNLSEVSYYSKTTRTNRKCFVILPANYSVEKKYPVLYLLHGIGGTDSEWLGGNPVQVIGNLVAEGKASDMIVVMPNVRAAANDSVPQNIVSQENIKAFDNFINDLNNDLMPFINSKYSVKQGRENTAIAGLSMGGRESLFIGFKEPDKFAYIGAFSPAPGLIPDSALNYPGQFTKAQFTIPAGSIYTPKVIMICSGNNDGTVGNTPYTYHQTLVQNNVNHTWYTMDGDHNFIVWKNGLYNFVKRIFKSTSTSENTTTPSATKVSAPTFSVTAGTYSTAQKVSLSSATTGSTIYYTTDGSTPTTSSAVYSSAITVSKTTTIKAIAVKNGMTNSDVASAAYTISTSTTTPTTEVASGIEVTYAVANNWGSGASVNVTIKNNGTTSINGWNLVMALPNGQSISSLWNASYTTSGSSVTVTNSAYNGSIAANGGTQTFGFNLNYSGAFSKPSSIKLNGIACTIK